MNNRQLLIRLKSKHTETLESYIYRLCRANGCSLKAFRSFIKQNFNVVLISPKPDDRTVVKKVLIGLTNNALQSSIFDQRVYKQGFSDLFEYQKIKLCVECYKNQGLLHQHWCFKHYLVCSHHNLLLVDRCDKCNHQFSEETIVSELCVNCSKPLKDIQQEQRDIDGISFEISKLSEIGRDELNAIKKLILPLSPYGMLLDRKEYRSWFSSKETEMSQLYETQSKILLVFNNRVYAQQLIFDYINNTPGSIGTKFGGMYYQKLRTNSYSEFKADLRTVLIDNAERFVDFNMNLKWIETALGLLSVDIESRITLSVQSKLKGSDPFSVRHMSVLRDLN